ncbi:MAG: SAM-dependent methyltransferase [Betaproteobacteria bacterium]|nr:SAM-dependent methyltransferase [Betaproteobacteria bacterium]
MKSVKKPQPSAAFILPPEIRPGQSPELLRELHILTRDGRLNQDSRRKLKQVYHLCQFIAPLFSELPQSDPIILVDHGAGKSYLGFILYDLFLKTREASFVYGVETCAELVTQSRNLAAKLGFTRMAFHALSIAEAVTSPLLPQSVDLVTALHACDTATDDAIRFALARNARFIVLIPCCQAEVAAALRAQKAKALAEGAVAELWRHPIHSREFGAHLTNVLRVLLLQAHGYQVTVTELIGWEHSLKNELIIARYTGNPRGDAQKRAENL